MAATQWGSGLAGLKQSRKCRATGTRISIYDAVPAGLCDEGGRWQTVCEDHGSICSHETLALAQHHAAWPAWCTDCQVNLGDQRTN